MKKSQRTIDPSKVSKGVRDANPHLFGCSIRAFDSTILDKQNASVKVLEVNRVIGKRRRQMNKTETAYSNLLEARRRAGEITHWFYEGITLMWGTIDVIRYTPDFAIIGLDGISTFIETKGGYIRDTGMQKFKAARNQWPMFRFEMWQHKQGKWSQIY